jgi:syntaxin-binding protein 4
MISLTQDNPVIQKRMAVLGCQLRKSEVTKKTYEVATDKLLQFVEVNKTTIRWIINANVY